MARRWKLALPVALIAAGVGLYAAWPHLAGDPEDQVERLTALLAIRPGMTVAEVGAGEGRMSVAMARRVGPGGRVLATEIEAEKLDNIRKAATRASVGNLTAMRAGEKQTNLPPECCDAIFLRRVYHHITAPEPVNLDLWASLRPGGRVAVIDFRPTAWMFWLPRPDGVPENRGGHGAPPQVVIEEMTRAGFVLERQIDDWPGWDYCLVFRKAPEPRVSASSGF